MLDKLIWKLHPPPSPKKKSTVPQHMSYAYSGYQLWLCVFVFWCMWTRDHLKNRADCDLACFLGSCGHRIMRWMWQIVTWRVFWVHVDTGSWDDCGRLWLGVFLGVHVDTGSWEERGRGRTRAPVVTGLDLHQPAQHQSGQRHWCQQPWWHPRLLPRLLCAHPVHCQHSRWGTRPGCTLTVICSLSVSSSLCHSFLIKCCAVTFQSWQDVKYQESVTINSFSTRSWGSCPTPPSNPHPPITRLCILSRFSWNHVQMICWFSLCMEAGSTNK